MTQPTTPVTFVEIYSPDLATSRRFFADAFGWDPQPFAADDYLVAPRGDRPGIDTALTRSQDGQPRTVPVVGVADLATAVAQAEGAGGTVVVPTFTVPGVGRGCYVIDPVGVLVGLHEADPDA